MHHLFINSVYWALQFAMGLNMPAKTVVFTSVKKWDGDANRYIGSGEYIQVKGFHVLVLVE